MKEITPPLKTRYAELKITAYCRTKTCQAGFELDVYDLHRSSEGWEDCLYFTCPHCKQDTEVDRSLIKDKALFEFIKDNAPIAASDVSNA